MAQLSFYIPFAPIRRILFLKRQISILISTKIDIRRQTMNNTNAVSVFNVQWHELGIAPSCRLTNSNARFTFRCVLLSLALLVTKNYVIFNIKFE